jgi:hypothetical protein
LKIENEQAKNILAYNLQPNPTSQWRPNEEGGQKLEEKVSFWAQKSNAAKFLIDNISRL